MSDAEKQAEIERLLAEKITKETELEHIVKKLRALIHNINN